MIHKQAALPTKAQVGDAWVDPQGTFKRVLSRGGAWENVNLGSKHPDEADHGSEQRSEAEQQNVSTDISAGTDPVSQGDGDNGEVPGTGQEPEGAKDTGLEDGGVDGNGSPVV